MTATNKCVNDVSDNDRDVLRPLIEEKLRVAAMPEQAERKKNWQAHNDLKADTPWMMYSYEIPWCEMNVDDELTCLCQDPFLRRIEWNMRTELYQWRHLSDDIVIEPFVDYPLAVSDDGFGVVYDEDLLDQPTGDHVKSHHYKGQFAQDSDIEKLRETHVMHDEAESAERRARLQDAVGDLTELRPTGPKLSGHVIDDLSTYYGIQDMLMDLMMRPDFMHAIIKRYLELLNNRLDQYIELNVLSLNTRNVVFGYGSYGYTSELPAEGFDPARVRPCDCWTSTAPQIFTEVSPDMHEEFALRYEKEWLKRFGLSYYGCCGKMHHKIDLLRKHIPNLRKISCSPWSDPAIMAEQIGRDYVVSLKPSPAYLAEDAWRPEAVRADLQKKKDALKGTQVEILIKDISTVRNEPRRLWEWSRIAREVFKSEA